MKRFISIFLFVAMILTLIPAVSLAAVRTGQSNVPYYSYADIVERTYNMEYLATVPKGGEGAKEITSADRSAVYNAQTGLYENWDANVDNSGYVRVDEENGYRVLADLTGPGYLTRLWAGQDWMGNLHIYIDGELVVDMPFAEFVHGEAFAQYDQLSMKANYVDMTGFAKGYQGGIDLFVPITYNESCLVEIDCDARSDFYYIVGYYDLEDGATVEPFTYPLSAENEAALAVANAQLNDRTIPTGEDNYNATVSAGETVTLYEKNEPGAIKGFSVNLNIPAAELDAQTSLTEWLLNIYWDNSTEPAVSMTVADFFGIPYGLYESTFDNAGIGAADDGTLYSTWYMPYQAAKVTLTNQSKTARVVDASFVSETLTQEEAQALTRFHANWQRPEEALSEDRKYDSRFLYVEGEGRFVGTSLHVYQVVDLGEYVFWGEGDEKIFVDGEKTPSWAGTGTEDYFCYAWGDAELFDFAYFGQPYNNDSDAPDDLYGYQTHGNKVNYRMHILDNVCFHDSIEFCLEKYFEDTMVRFGATTYFYLTRETSSNHQQTAFDASDRLFNTDELTGPALLYPGMYLPARLISKNTSTDFRIDNLNSLGIAGYTWYGGNMFWPISAKGKEATFLLSIPESGTYKLNASMTQAFDYGIYEFSIDDAVLGTIDTYAADLSIQLTELGPVALTAGAHVLKLKCVGRNDSSQGYYLGVDYLEFVPFTEQAGTYFVDNLTLLNSIAAKTLDANAWMTDAGLAMDRYQWENNQSMFMLMSQDATISFSLPTTKAGKYQLTVSHTTAIDFGKMEVLIDGVSYGELDGFSINTVLDESTFYDVDLTAGEHELTLRCIGKNRNSGNYYFGLNYVKLEPQSEYGAWYVGAANLLDNMSATTGETPVPQANDFFRDSWDREMQMFWNAAEGQSCDFDIEIPADADYSMTVRYTHFIDFGKMEILIDDVAVTGVLDGFSGETGAFETTVDNVSLTKGTHKLTVHCLGKNEQAAGSLIGISSIRFTAPYVSPQAGPQTTPDPLAVPKNAACEALRAYLNTALLQCEALQEQPLREVFATGMLAIWNCAQIADIDSALAAAKTAIDTVLVTTYEEELEIDELEDVFIEGLDLEKTIVSYTTASAPVGQGMDPEIWSRGTQLLWLPQQANETIIFEVSVPTDAVYDMTLAYGTAVDFGIFEVWLDETRMTELDAFGNLGVKTAELGQINLAAGTHTLKFVITGKNVASGGYLMSVDHVIFAYQAESEALIASRLAAINNLTGYKNSKDYSTEQWQVVQQVLAEQIDLINACQTAEAVINAWKAAKTALDAVESGLLDYDNISFDPTKTPADFGWHSDDENFINWQVTKNGEPFYVAYDGSNSKRIWKNLIEDPDNFTVQLTVKVGAKRAEIEIMGVHIELNCENGNGNQIFDRESWSWFTAEDQICDVTVARAGGGPLTVKFQGCGNNEAVVFTKAPVNPSDRNLYVGVIDAGGSAFFSDMKDLGLDGQNAGDFGWDTDEINGKKDFTGWTSVDGMTIAADYDRTTGNHRIWRGLITDQEHFTVKTTVTANNTSSGYLKVLGQTLELDGRNGDGNQIGIKLNGTFQEWVAADGCTADIYMIRDGGDIQVNVVGKNGVSTYTLTPSEESNNLELGVYAGEMTFADIKVNGVIGSLRQIPFGTAFFTGDFAGAWANSLCRDISEYQNYAINSTVAAGAVNTEATADLTVVSDGLTALRSGTAATEFLADFESKLTALKTAQKDGSVIVVTGLPYVSDADIDLAEYAAYNAGIRALCEEMNLLYADIYTAMGERDWTWEEDSLSDVGKEVVAGEVLNALMRNCTCLAVNSKNPLNTAVTAPVAKTQEALSAFVNAADAASMSTAIEAEALGLSLKLYRSLTSAAQGSVLSALVAADRTAVDSFEKADALFLQKTMEVSRTNPKADMSREIHSYVSVGDSITEGYMAIDTRTDAWTARFADLLNKISGGVTFTNLGIGGTRMCTASGNYPAAKDTVDSYIVANSPDLLTVAYGINDFHAGTSKTEFLTTYRAYVQEIRTKCPETTVMLVGIIAKTGQADGAALREWNAGIKQIAEENGCIFVDAYDDLRGVEWLLDDGLHPNNAGYRLLANAVLRVFNKYIHLTPAVVVTPEDFGWSTDLTDGIMDFSGWTATDAATLTGNFNETVGNHRVWKSLITDQNAFTVDADITVNSETSAYIKVLGVIIELDGRNGSGNQAYPKIDGSNGDKDWLAADGGKVHINIVRNGGDLTITLTGSDGSFTYTAAPTESNPNVEFGLYAGNAAFKDLTVASETDPVPTEPIKIASAYLRIDENINVIYAAEVPADCTDPYMVFTFQGREIKVTNYTEDDGKLLFELSKVVPQCMGDNISATLYAKKDGKTVSDTVEEYSVRTYCENQLAKTSDAKLITLLSDLLTYGAAAQTYTGYKTDALVTSGLDLTPSTFTAIEANRASFTGEKSAVADWYSATLGLANELAMRFTFTAESVDGLSVDVTINGRTQTFTEFETSGDGRYAVMFRGIKATEFDDAVTASFKLGGESIGRTVSYSVNTYISSMQDCGAASLEALVKALYNYGASAEAFSTK